MEISLPGEQVQPLPKMGNRNKKNNQKNKPNGFICFANSQRSKLAPQYDIRGLFVFWLYELLPSRIFPPSSLKLSPTPNHNSNPILNNSPDPDPNLATYI